MSTGLHAGRATGLTVEESGENFTRTKSVARWSRGGRAAYEAEREAMLYVFFVLFFTSARCSNQTENDFMRGRGIFFLPNFFGFIFIVFCGAAVPCCAFSLVHTASISEEENDPPTYLGYVRTYGM